MIATISLDPLPYMTAVLALGVLAQWLAWRFKLPSILLLLAFGFLFGHVTGARIDDYLSADPHANPLLSVVSMLVAVILFEGGLTLKFAELKEAGAAVLRMCTLGVAVSFVLTTAFVYFAFGYDFRVAGIVGAILTVTGPTVVAPLLRHINPTRKVASIVKWEGIVVDPIGAILAVLVFQLAAFTDAEPSGHVLLMRIGLTLVVEAGLAILLAKLLEQMLKRHWIPDYLQPVFFLGVAVVLFAAANFVQAESGLLMVTVLGVALANQDAISVKHILEFKENLRVLIISGLFVVLSGRIDTDLLQATLPKGLCLLAFLVVVARPASVFLANAFSTETTTKERIFLASLAPRGIVAAAVASVFALELEEAVTRAGEGGVIAGAAMGGEVAAQAGEMVALIFIVIVGTVAVYGLLAAPLARRLGLAVKNPCGVLFAGADAWVLPVAEAIQQEGHRVVLLDTNYRNVANAKMKGLEGYRFNILSDFVEDELDFTGIGSLLAVTPNDEINSMACEKFINEFGRAHIWQLTPSDADQHHTTAVAHHMRGRLCFSGGPRYDELVALAGGGAVIKKTLLTEEFSLADFYAEHGADAHILFLESGDRLLQPAEVELEDVDPGTSIYALIPSSDAPSA